MIISMSVRIYRLAFEQKVPVARVKRFRHRFFSDECVVLARLYFGLAMLGDYNSRLGTVMITFIRRPEGRNVAVKLLNRTKNR